ncbi:unnamed protein product [Brugia pahangi]|uniref:Secreted protein n=1 Tax=Brugia pahangi TaxID=6280 RepID=A0A0N4TN86_BRUPA|nr:unnamed protein product [Brugia pahangi]
MLPADGKLLTAAIAQAVVTSITAACRCGVQSMSYVAFTTEHDQNVMPCNRADENFLLIFRSPGIRGMLKTSYHPYLSEGDFSI